MGHCALCDSYVPDEDLMIHLEEEHPEVDRTPATWPDGEVVVIDNTLLPEDFDEPRDG